MGKIITVLTSTIRFLVLVATKIVPCVATMRHSSKMKQPPNVMVAMFCEANEEHVRAYTSIVNNFTVHVFLD